MQLFLQGNSDELGPYYNEKNEYQPSPPVGRYHQGLDIAGKGGNIDDTDWVYSAGPGKVVYIDKSGTTTPLGHFVVIYHGVINRRHVYAFYAHMGNKARLEQHFIDVRVGQDVLAGTLIGRQGNSGATRSDNGGLAIHLHWEIRVSNDPINWTGWDYSRKNTLTVASPDFYVDRHFTYPSELAFQSFTAYSCESLQSEATSYPDGTLITDGKTTWVVQNSKYRGIQTPEILSSYGFTHCRALRVPPQALLPMCADSDPLRPPPNTQLVRVSRAGGDAWYRITDKGFKQGFTKPAAFIGLGYLHLIGNDWLSVAPSSEADLQKYPDDPASPTLTSPYSDGALVENEDDIGRTFLITNGMRQEISSQALQKMGLSKKHIIRIASGSFSEIEERFPLITEDRLASDCSVTLSSNSPPPAPSLFVPDQGARLSDGNVTFRWKLNADRDGDSLESHLLVQKSGGTWEPQFPGRLGTREEFSMRLEPGTLYEWTVAAVDWNMRSTPWYRYSGVRSFFVLAQTSQLDLQAQNDILKRTSSDSRFSSVIPNSLGQDQAWSPDWELRWMDFNFTRARLIRVFHATSRLNSSTRWTIFWDPDLGTWTNWQLAFP